MRRVARFSCGAASAVATKLALAKWPGEVIVTNTRMGGEHEDKDRMRADCEVWFGVPIFVRQSDEYADHMDVWEKERFIKGQHGTACRVRLKQAPWQDWEQPDDTLILGYTVEEQGRANSLRKMISNPIETPLIDAGLTKDDCLAMVQRAGIRLPTMYLLGYSNNNCIGCCRGGMGYWNKIRVDFPDRFQRAALIQRELGEGARLWIESDGTPIMLDQLDPKRGDYPSEPDISCSIMCHLAEQEFSA